MSGHIKTLLGWIRETAAPAKGLLIPVSGGSDSALCFWLCSQVYPKKTMAVHAGKELRERAWFEKTGAVEFTDAPGLHEEREEMRWARFLSLNLARGYWLVGSRNRTEDELGTYSLASRVTTYMPLVGVWKSDVLAMCREIGVPDTIIASSLRADPDCGRPAELAEISYESVETFLKARIGELTAEALFSLNEKQIEYLDGIHRRNGFKKKLPLRAPRIA